MPAPSSHPRRPSRDAVLDAIIASLEATVANAQAQAKIAHDEATGDESKQEGKYDTRAIEAGYLANAQARRLADTERAWKRFAGLRGSGPRERVDGPCLVIVESPDGSLIHYFVGPDAGGLRVTVAEVVVRVITPSSPLGASLLGLEPGDELDGDRGEIVHVE